MRNNEIWTLRSLNDYTSKSFFRGVDEEVLERRDHKFLEVLYNIVSTKLKDYAEGGTLFVYINGDENIIFMLPIINWTKNFNVNLEVKLINKFQY